MLPKEGRLLWERLDASAEHARLCRARMRNLVEVREPLVLISQIQRSGGTLLSQLFDSHPECHAHPYELQIGRPKKWNWPRLELDCPETWFELLFEKWTYLFLRQGYRKGSSDLFPFLFSPRLQKQVFDHLVAAWQPASARGVLDAYMSSYFNAWLDNRNLYGGPKKVVTAFVPRLVADADSVERFFAAYPDGRLISIVRDPRSWFASARTHRHAFADPVEAVPRWRRSVEAALATKESFGDRVVLLAFESLVARTEETMSRLADALGLTMVPQLLEPTYNGLPIRANSSDPIAVHGVRPERASSYREVLDDRTIVQIDGLAGDLYARAVERSLG